MNISNVEVTAGLGGFLVLFGLALVLWFLGRDLSRRLRRMRQGEAARRQAENERATKAAPPTSTSQTLTSPTSTPPETPPPAAVQPASEQPESEAPTGEDGTSSPRE